jgi:hypothetical protein
VQLVEEHDEDAVVRIRRQRQHFADRVRIPPRGLGQTGLDAHELEILDRLRLAVLENLEVPGRQSLDDAAVTLGIDVDGDEYGLSAKDGGTLLCRLLAGYRGCAAG